MRSPVAVASPISELHATPLASWPLLSPSFAALGSLHKSGSTSSQPRNAAVAGPAPSFFFPQDETPGVQRTGSRGWQGQLGSSPGGLPRSGSQSGILLRSAAGAGAGAGAGCCLSAPSGYSESVMSDTATPSFSMHAPTGWTDDEDEGEVVESRRRRWAGCSTASSIASAPAISCLAPPALIQRC